MCLIITAFAAIAVTAVRHFKPELRKTARLGMLALMYWGAAIMWTVDGFVCVAAGEHFLELSGSDALLGAVVVLSGLMAWLVSLLLGNPKRVLSAIKGAGKAQ